MEEKELNEAFESGEETRTEDIAETAGNTADDEEPNEGSETEETEFTEDLSYTAKVVSYSSKRVSAEIYSWFDTMLHALLAVVVIFTFFTKMSTVDGTSMVPTLEDQQRLMISNFFYTPAYNDIVVVWSDLLPNDEGGWGKAIVKRVIGLPGDSISIDYEHGIVYRNGEQLSVEFKDDQLYEDGHKINSYTNDEEGCGGEFLVPDGHLFVMGDNRNGSTDSRSFMVGYIDIRKVIGKAYLRIWPFDKISGLY